MNGPTLTQRLQDLETNPTLLSFYTKSNCKRCLGKGKITRSVPAFGGTWNTKEQFCECVYTTLKKEMQTNG